MSIQSEISRIENSKNEIRESIFSKGVNVPENEHINTYSQYINQIISFNDVFDIIYPINIIIVFYDNEDHSSFCGLSWERCLSGNFPVGINTSDSDFSSIGNKGGEKAHAITPQEAPPLSTDAKAVGINGSVQHIESYSGSNGSPHNNLPPYEVVSFWRRVS